MFLKIKALLKMQHSNFAGYLQNLKYTLSCLILIGLGSPLQQGKQSLRKNRKLKKAGNQKAYMKYFLLPLHNSLPDLSHFEVYLFYPVDTL